MPWQDWAVAVLSNISAPSSPTNLATLLGWTAQEKTGLHPAPPIGPWATQWNNPLNTTQPWPGAIDVNPVGVKQYLTLGDGAGATVVTLTNGFYPAIVANLKASLPASWWTGAARPELDTWGTGQVWLDFVPLTGDVMATLDDIYNMLRIGVTVDGQADSLLMALVTGQLPRGAPYNQAPSILQKILDQGAKQATAAQLTQAVTDLKAAIAAITAGGLTAAQATQLTQAHDAIVRIETALRAA
jgi:hypothetical protein